MRASMRVVAPVTAILLAAALIVVWRAAAAAPAAPAPSTSATTERLVITEGGTPDDPRVFSGAGQVIGGIDIAADNVIVTGYLVDEPEAPGIEILGDNVTVRGVTVSHPHGPDGDGIRFFGNGITIRDNTIRGTDNAYGHADCMQTFADDTPASSDVRIENNRCEDIDNMCLMAEGPNDGEGDGIGRSARFTFTGNHCETREASQQVMIENIVDVELTGNEFVGATDHAIGLAIGSTGATVGGNTLDPGIGCEVGIDESSRDGYVGPEPGCAP